MKNILKIFGRVGLIAGVVIGVIIIFIYEQLIPEEIEYPVVKFEVAEENSFQERQLSMREMMSAITAWHYFENYTDSITGVTSSYSNEKIISTCDISTNILAIHSARKLGIITTRQFNKRLESILVLCDSLKQSGEGIFFTEYSLDNLHVTDSSLISVFTAMELSSVLSSVVLNNPKFRKKAFRILTKVNPEEVIRRYRRKTEKNLINHEVYNLYIKTLQFPDSLLINEKPESTSGILNFEKFFRFLLNNRFNKATELLTEEYLQLEQKYYASDSLLPVFTTLHLGKNEQFNYIIDPDSVITVSSRKGIVIENTFVTVSGAFIRQILDDDDNAKVLFDEVDDLFDQKNGWYEGVFNGTNEIITFLNAETNASVINTLCIKSFQNYY